MHHLIGKAVATTGVGALALMLGTPAAVAATPQGTPPETSNSHLTIPISGQCDGVPLTLVAGDSDHAAAQVTSGGSGHLLPVSFTFVFADGSQFTDVVLPHPTRPTVTCELAGVGPEGAPVTVDVVAVWQRVGK